MKAYKLSINLEFLADDHWEDRVNLPSMAPVLSEILEIFYLPEGDVLDYQAKIIELEVGGIDD